MSNQTVEEIERNIKLQKEIIEFGKAVERLQSNRDFRKVVTEGYFEKEAVRLVHLKADPEMQRPEIQAGIIQAIDAIGNMSQFLRDAVRSAELAAKSVSQDEETRDEILAEELAK
jgi:hypothetical protein